MGRKRNAPKIDDDGYLRTGIYRRYVGPCKTQNTVDIKELHAQMAAVEKKNDAERLQEYRNSLKPLLESFIDGPFNKGEIDYQQAGNYVRLDFGDGSLNYRQSEKLSNGSIESNKALDAIEALHKIAKIEFFLAKDAQISMLMNTCIQLGMIFERIDIRDFEYPALLGKESIQRAEAMRQEKRPKAELRQEAEEALEQAKKDYSNRGLTFQKERAAESLGIRKSAFYERLRK